MASRRPSPSVSRIVDAGFVYPYDDQFPDTSVFSTHRVQTPARPGAPPLLRVDTLNPTAPASPSHVRFWSTTQQLGASAHDDIPLRDIVDVIAQVESAASQFRSRRSAPRT